MKNFRKVLALVLVVATLFSFTAMAGAAYKDDADISYDEAVGVLSAVGILNGYEDETFKPTQTISREEMAKMIAVLANAGDDVSKLYASATTFADVPSARWSASYVAYCAKTGIVAGRSASTFDPTGKVTGLETAKMLLVTLGFSAEEQGYVGADWKVNVLRDAKVMGLLNGFASNYDPDVAITREEAAQMMLNALEAPCVVGIVSDGLVTVTNALVVNWKGLGNGSGLDMLKNLLKVTAYGQLKDSIKAGQWALYGNVIISNDLLCDRLYKMDKDEGIDCYGRPSTVWTINGKKLTAFAEAPVWSSYNTNAGEVAEVLEDLGHKAAKVTYVNGDKKDPVYGKGVLVEVFADGEVVCIVTALGEVTAVVKATNKFVIDGKNALCFSNKGYGFAEGDVILYWLCADGLHFAEKAEATVATLTRAETVKGSAAKSSFVAGGASYEYAYGYAQPIFGVEDVKAGKAYTIYTDNYGYVMQTAEYKESVETLYAYLVAGTGSRTITGQDGKGNNIVVALRDMVDFEAEYNEDVKVNDDLWQATKTASGLYKYEVSNGVVVNAVAATETADVLKANGDLYKDGKAVAYGNANTQYLVRTWDYAEKAYVYNAYTEDTLPASFVAGTIVYFDKVVNNTTIATYVFADALYAESASSAFILSYAKSVSDEKFVKQIGAYDAYKAVVDGAVGYVLVTETDPIVDNVPGLYNGDLKVIGLEDDGLPVYAAYNFVPANVENDVMYYGEEVLIDGVSYDVAEDLIAVVIGLDGKPVILESAAELNNYLESEAALGHVKHEEIVDGEDVCYGYDLEKGWMVESKGTVYELYIDLTKAN